MCLCMLNQKTPKWKGKNSVKPWKCICMSNDFDDNSASDGVSLHNPEINNSSVATLQPYVEVG